MSRFLHGETQKNICCCCPPFPRESGLKIRGQKTCGKVIVVAVAFAKSVLFPCSSVFFLPPPLSAFFTPGLDFCNGRKMSRKSLSFVFVAKKKKEKKEEDRHFPFSNPNKSTRQANFAPLSISKNPLVY